jgi:hypothetical protein
MSAVALPTPATAADGAWPQRAAALDWHAATEALHQQGNAVLPHLLCATECAALARLYGHAGETTFRSRVVMQRHGFGQGEYRYFSYPLPDVVASLREALYPHLAPIANQWNTAMGIDVRYPARHADFMAHCHAAGQVRPTPGTTTVCTRTCMASMCSRCRWRCCCQSRGTTSRAANSC